MFVNHQNFSQVHVFHDHPRSKETPCLPLSIFLQESKRQREMDKSNEVNDPGCSSRYQAAPLIARLPVKYQKLEDVRL